MMEKVVIVTMMIADVGVILKAMHGVEMLYGH